MSFFFLARDLPPPSFVLIPGPPLETRPGMKLLERIHDFSLEQISLEPRVNISRAVIFEANLRWKRERERETMMVSSENAIRLHSNHFVDRMERSIAGDVNRTFTYSPSTYWQVSTSSRIQGVVIYFRDTFEDSILKEPRQT